MSASTALRNVTGYLEGMRLVRDALRPGQGLAVGSIVAPAPPGTEAASVVPIVISEAELKVLRAAVDKSPPLPELAGLTSLPTDRLLAAIESLRGKDLVVVLQGADGSKSLRATPLGIECARQIPSR